MENEENFELNLRSKLGVFSEEPPARVWEGVKTGITRKRRRPWFFIFSGLLLIGIIFSCYFDFFVPEEPRVITQKNPYDEAEILQPSIKNISGKNSQDEIAPKAMFSEEGAKVSDESLNLSKAPIQIEKKDLDSHGNVNTKLAESGAKVNDNFSDEISENTMRWNYFKKDSYGSRMMDSEEMSSLKKASESDSNLFLAISRMPYTFSPIPESKILPVSDPYVKELPPRYMRPYSWSMDIVFGSGIHWSVYGNDGVENPVFASGRDSSARPYQFYDAGLRLQRSYRNGSFFSIGFLLGNRRDRFGFEYTVETTQTIIDSSKYITVVDPVLPPQIIKTYDTSIVVLRQTRKLQQEVSMQYYRIPLRAGYRFVQERMIFSISGGLDLGWIRASGIVVDPLVMETYNSSRLSIYRTSVLGDVVVSMGWECKVGEKISFIAEPYFSKAITNLYGRTEFGSSRPFQAAFLAGLRFKP